MSKKKDLTREKAIDMLWRQGELSWKLRGCQKEIRQTILNSTDNIQVVAAGRRTGKSYSLCLMALELCIKHPNTIVKYACPKQRMVSTIIRPIFRDILVDCPADIKPEWKTAEKIFLFPNGSEVHIAGTDNENMESLRGARADFAILDEAGFMDQVGYLVRSVMSPILKTSKLPGVGGKLVMASTPSKNSNHEFMEKFFFPMQIAGKLKVYTIHDNPNFDDKIREEIRKEYPLLERDPEYLREYMCVPTDTTENSILPSFNAVNRMEIVTEDMPMPAFCHRYTGMDVGGSDLTVVLFGFYDYMNATLCIQDEVVTDGNCNTELLAQMIREKEKLHWTNPIDKTVTEPYLRVSDNNNAILLTDLQKLHGLSFSKSKKDKKEAAINALDVDFMRKNIKIHPRCKTLIYHLSYAEWNNARTDFKRLKDSTVGELRGGHADALAAMMYLHRSVVKSANPFPKNYGEDHSPSDFRGFRVPEKPHSQVGEAFKKLFTLKSRKK
jgi:PBSX family phage terminase large subunit